MALQNRHAAMGAAVVMIGVAVGCSGPTTSSPPPKGSLPVGTAQVTIGGNNVGETYAVSCSQGQALTTITTGDETQGTTSVVDTADGVTARSVEIRDVAGFTGSYWNDLGDNSVDVRTVGRTYEIAGTATGFNAEVPYARATEEFSIKVSC